jgi:hypothetical protein
LIAVTDGNPAVRNAVKSVWPGGRVTLVRCVFHWRKNLVERVTGDLARALGQPGTSAAVRADELLRLAHKAFSTPADFLAFVQAAHDRFDAAPTAALCLDWLEDHGRDALAQLHAAPEMQSPQSIGPLEQVIHRTRQRIAGRAQGLRNPVRTQRMVDLLAAGLRNDANTDQWADLIYAHLAENHRRPARRQRDIAGLRM